ncbi:hypothetical protein [Vibrio sonorensis]|uniref:hypothetical protein n=1 Tax=Vibrio sonorensis TaxID=1004316 RepID=UPI0009FE204C|nr:hypothetical protein [Vibrio sonorensis]
MSLPVTVTDDVPTLTERNIVQQEGDDFSSTVKLFARGTDKGADGATVTEVEAVNGTDSTFFVDAQSNVTLARGWNEYQITQEYTPANTGTPETRLLGTLRIHHNGNVRFDPEENLDQEGDSLQFSLNVTATDGDGDQSTVPVNITITDKLATAEIQTLIATEDTGRGIDSSLEQANAKDNVDGSALPEQLNFEVSLGDRDNGETLQKITITDGNPHGTFYYKDGSNYIALPLDGNNKPYLTADLMDKANNGDDDNYIETISNIYFVPDRHYSTNSDGFRVDYQLETHNSDGFDHSITDHFIIKIQNVADTADWNQNQTDNLYTTQEDSDWDDVQLQIQASTQDRSRPETITYLLSVVQGEGDFVLRDKNGDVINKNSDGVYEFTVEEMKDVYVDPDDHFSGQIEFSAVAKTEEQDTFSALQEAQSAAQQLIVDVSPHADSGGTISTRRISIFEDNALNQDSIDPSQADQHDPFLLSEVITLSGSADQDSSEVLYVRISNVSLEGVTLKWLDDLNPSQINQQNTPTGELEYYEIPYQYLSLVEVVPPLHSNEDFNFRAEGIVKDTATLSSGESVDITSIGSKPVYVSVKALPMCLSYLVCRIFLVTVERTTLGTTWHQQREALAPKSLLKRAVRPK